MEDYVQDTGSLDEFVFLISNKKFISKEKRNARWLQGTNWDERMVDFVLNHFSFLLFTSNHLRFGFLHTTTCIIMRISTH